jgi:hypothetical protein
MSSKKGESMRLLKFAVVLVAVAALPFMAMAAQHEGAKKAKTIDELAKMYDSSGCKGCHAEIYAQWRVDAHPACSQEGYTGQHSIFRR